MKTEIATRCSFSNSLDQIKFIYLNVMKKNLFKYYHSGKLSSSQDTFEFSPANRRRLELEFVAKSDGTLPCVDFDRSRRGGGPPESALKAPPLEFGSLSLPRQLVDRIAA